jgi:long-chain acyl-CoA synthetase
VLIDAMYAGETSQYIETQVKFEDGRTGKVAADLKIRDCKKLPAVQAAA